MNKITLVLTLFITFISYSQIDELTVQKGETTSTKEKQSALFEETKKNAEAGQMIAQYALGVMYYLGEGTKKNLEQAFYWFRKSALEGVVGAKANLGYMYYNGEGTLKSYKDAFYWIQGGLGFEVDAKVLFYFGRMYYYGQGTEVNKKEAAYWIKKSYEAAFENGFHEQAQKFWEDNKLWEHE